MPAQEGTGYYGEVFEHFMVLEIYRLNEIHKKDFKLSYYQTHASEGEVDLVLSRGRRKPILIQIKSSKRVDITEVHQLARYHESLGADQSYYVSQDTQRQKEGPVTRWVVHLCKTGKTPFSFLHRRLDRQAQGQISRGPLPVGAYQLLVKPQPLS